ncbi:hypothetical protein [Tsukamurella tyrosinosolvens]|uniref:hypothetical protein n=1 Tax=Tsukamurella tyrosinosolvens TaxID=57704 RepID=UPI000CA34B7B|nr:hypothetical protein [Tsukamurella tyrosinosolvens]AUN38655.1 hypothetical protein ASU32_00385 [Tsukamurella tyrosinosolvens]
MTDSLHFRPPSRRALRGAAALIAVAVLTLIHASPASAHHGWDGFETTKLLYVAGTVSSEGNWGDPHSEFDVDLDPELPATPPDLRIPAELSGPEDRVRVQAAPGYDGAHRQLEIIIAPPWWSRNNGLDRSLRVGERFQGVGYINRTDDGLFRPVAFWYGDDHAPVNQVIGNSLPVRAPLPGTVEADQARDATAAAPAGDGSSAWGVWSVFGAVMIVAVAGGAVYVRRRGRPDERHLDA